jgi:hypothetical protein
MKKDAFTCGLDAALFVGDIGLPGRASNVI